MFLYLSGSGTKPTHNALGGSARWVGAGHRFPAGSGEKGEEDGDGGEEEDEMGEGWERGQVDPRARTG